MTVAAEFKIEYLQYLDTDGKLVRDDAHGVYGEMR